MGDFNFHFENVENKNSRKLHDIIDMFNLTQSVSEPTHNQGHLLDLVFSKQSDNILTSTKLHHGLTSDHTAILCKLDVSVPVQKPKTFLYRCLKKIDTGAFKQDLSHAVSQSVLSATTITISVLSLTSTPLSAVAQSVQGSRRPGSAVLRSSSVSWNGSVGRRRDDGSNLSSPSTNRYTTPLNR